MSIHTFLYMRKSTLILGPVIGIAMLTSAASCNTGTASDGSPLSGPTTSAVTPSFPDTSFPDTSFPDATSSAPDTPAGPTYTESQQNAIDSAQQYLAMQPFSKAGLINQLSSSAGEGYPMADAVFAVNHIGPVDWTHEAYLSAKQYLQMQPQSLSDLITQLESSAGEGFTHAQAVAGATQAYNEK